MSGLARLLVQLEEAPACRATLPKVLARIFSRKDQYNAFTGEGTENHIAMSRCPGLIFSQLASRQGDIATAPQRLAQMRAWIGQWSQLALQKGGSGEWNSGTYAAYNLTPWLLVYDFADRGEERAAAKPVLDLYATDLARKCSGGSLGGAESRSSRSDTSRTWNSAEYLLWFWFSVGCEAPVWEGAEYLPLVHLALSRYRPPSDLLALARKNDLPPTQWRKSLPDYLLQFPNRSGEIFYATSAYTLGSAQLDWGGWTNGSLQLLPWKLVAWNSNGIHKIFWGNSGYRSIRHARGRNPFDQLVQHRNILVQMTRIPCQAGAIESEIRRMIDDPLTGWRALHARDFTARWGYPPENSPIRYDPQLRITAPAARQSRLFFPPDLPPQALEGVYFGEWEQLCIAARPLSGQPTLWDTENSSLVDSADYDAICGWLFETALVSEDADGVRFRQKVLSNTSLIPHPILSYAFIYHH